MSARQNRRHEMRRRAIIDAAATVFKEHGLHAATLDQIGEEVGLSKASLYYYITGKDEIIAEVLKAVLDAIDERVDKRTTADLSPLDQLKIRAEEHVLTACEHPAGRLVIENLDSLAGSHTTAKMLRQHEEPARQLLQTAIDNGQVRTLNVTAAVKLLYGGLNNIPRWHNPADHSLEQVIEQTWEIFINGIQSA